MDYKFVNYYDDKFPKRLKASYMQKKIEGLYYLGDLNILKRPAVALVGSREISSYGYWLGHYLGEKLGQAGVTVISGMARGFDSAAHLGCLKAGGSTVAVLGCGIERCYPRENVYIKNQIAREGLVISQFPPDMGPTRYNFPIRNELVAGLSDIVVVGEAGIHSGAAITADIGINQGKLVMAVPGNINSKFSLGTNKLIQDGAEILVTVEDILQNLNIDLNLKSSEEVNLGADERIIYNLIASEGEQLLGEISRKSGIDVKRVMGIVTVLEMKGMVGSAQGRAFLV